MLMKALWLFAALTFSLCGQTTVRFSATSGDLSLSGSGDTETLQQPATNASQVYIDKVTVYCSAACTFTQTVNGTGATTTAGTVTPILPTQLGYSLPVNYFTASNVGTGTKQGGVTHVPAGSTVVICLSPTCGESAQFALSTGIGITANYSIVIASVTAIVNVTFFGRSVF